MILTTILCTVIESDHLTLSPEVVLLSSSERKVSYQNTPACIHTCARTHTLLLRHTPHPQLCSSLSLKPQLYLDIKTDVLKVRSRHLIFALLTHTHFYIYSHQLPRGMATPASSSYPSQLVQTLNRNYSNTSPEQGGYDSHNYHYVHNFAVYWSCFSNQHLVAIMNNDLVYCQVCVDMAM